MAELDAPAPEKARKAFARVLQAFAVNGKASAMAVQMGVSDSTISRIKNEKLEDAITVLYLAGFKVVDSHAVVIDEDELRGLRLQAMRLMSYENEHHGLLGDGEE